jgi:hypothetical protein
MHLNTYGYLLIYILYTRLGASIEDFDSTISSPETVIDGNRKSLSTEYEDTRRISVRRSIDDLLAQRASESILLKKVMDAGTYI